MKVDWKKFQDAPDEWAGKPIWVWYGEGCPLLHPNMHNIEVLPPDCYVALAEVPELPEPDLNFPPLIPQADRRAIRASFDAVLYSNEAYLKKKGYHKLPEKAELSFRVRDFYKTAHNGSLLAALNEFLKELKA